MQITRRGFLKGAVFSGTAAAAAAVGVTVPGTALAAADEAASAPSVNPYLDLYDGGVSYLPVREVGEKPTFRNGKGPSRTGRSAQARFSGWTPATSW